MLSTALLTAAAFAQGWLAPPQPVALEVYRDPITDAVSAFAIARADRMRLAVGCAPDHYKGIRVSLSGSLWFAGEKLLTGRRNFVYRFDEAEPVLSAWTTEDRTAVMQPRSYTPRFLGWMVVSDELVMRVRDMEGREVDVRFALAGADQAVRGMLQACGAAEAEAAVFPAG